MKIAICDDEAIQVKLIRTYVEEWSQTIAETVCCFEYDCASALLFDLDQGIDLFLLDIQMKDYTGMDLAKEIRKTNEQAIIIFISGVSDYIFEGFNVKALNYLLKPIKKEQLFVCLNQAYQHYLEDEAYFTFISEKETFKINIKKIRYAEARLHYLELHVDEQVYTIKMNLSELIEQLPNQTFCQIHRSFLVNLAYIDCINKQDILLSNQEVLPLARRKWETINQAFIDYYRSQR